MLHDVTLVWPRSCNIVALEHAKYFDFFYFKALCALSNMLQHIATGWPNVCNMLCTTMLWHVVLASPFTIRSKSVVICCVEMLGAFGRGLIRCLLWFCMIGWKNSRHFLNQSEVKDRAIRDSVTHVFPRFTRLHVASFDWFTALSMSFVIG